MNKTARRLATLRSASRIISDAEERLARAKQAVVERAQEYEQAKKDAHEARLRMINAGAEELEAKKRMFPPSELARRAEIHRQAKAEYARLSGSLRAFCARANRAIREVNDATNALEGAVLAAQVVKDGPADVEQHLSAAEERLSTLSPEDFGSLTRTQVAHRLSRGLKAALRHTQNKMVAAGEITTKVVPKELSEIRREAQRKAVESRLRKKAEKELSSPDLSLSEKRRLAQAAGVIAARANKQALRETREQLEQLMEAFDALQARNEALQKENEELRARLGVLRVEAAE
jgi:hypothetical protein